MKNATGHSGFTLIELSIVLVVIGFIVGGILTGQSLIRAAAIQATLTQLNRFNAAAATFRAKYGYLPGDIPGTKAQVYGLYYVTGGLSNTTACGDGNGSIQGWNASPWVDGANFAGEVVMFFLHLSQAGLIEGMYGAGGAHVTIQGATTTGGSFSTNSNPPTITGASTYVNEILPAAKIGLGNYFTIGSYKGNNYYILTGISKMVSSADLITTNNLTPQDAYTMDQKIDDGAPATGKVFALDTVTNTISIGNAQEVITTSVNNCVNGGDTAYNIANTAYANLLNCSLRFDFQ